MDVKNNKIWSKVRKAFATDEVLRQNEIEANRFVSYILFITYISVIIISVLDLVGVLTVGKEIMLPIFISTTLFIVPSVIICFIFKGTQKWMKYLLMFISIFVVANLDAQISFSIVLLMVLPVLLSCRYYSKQFTITVAIFSVVVFLISTSASVFVGWKDANVAMLEPGTVMTIDTTVENAIESSGYSLLRWLKDTIEYSYMPRFIVFTVLTIACASVADSGKKMVLRQAEMMTKSARVNSELSLATDIQANMLPSVFPPFPEHDEFEIYATMIPAKEVGGDFYDMFMLDENHIAVVIADVSGKGVPAALFMAITKTLIKNHTQSGLKPEEVFTTVNNILCESNEAGLFVTAWMGILDISRGDLTYVNAGHNPPLVKSNNGEFEYLKGRSGLVLAGMEGIAYKQSSIKLEIGDKLFLYTDGVTEATDKDNELYGEERLKNYLNSHIYDDVTKTLKGVKSDIDEFVGEAEQFDDLTMLELEYKKYAKKKIILKKRYEATRNEFTSFMHFLENQLEKLSCPPKALMEISVAAEEIFINIVNYAYETDMGTIDIRFEFIEDERKLILSFIDRGKPFDPLKKVDPDIAQSADDRPIGGLGIYMVKKTMDDVYYMYENGCNVLTITKAI